MVIGFCFHWRAHRFNLWFGNLDPTNHVAKKKKKRIESNFLKKLLALMIHFIKTFLAAPQGMWDLGVPPLPNPRDQVPYSRSPGKLSSCMQLFFDLTLLIIRFLVFLGTQVSPCSRVKDKQTHKPVCDTVFL